MRMMFIKNVGAAEGVCLEMPPLVFLFIFSLLCSICYSHCIINFLACMNNVIKMKYNMSALFSSCQIQGPITTTLLFFYTGKHCSETQCSCVLGDESQPLLYTGARIQVFIWYKWVILLHKSISSKLSLSWEGMGGEGVLCERRWLYIRKSFFSEMREIILIYDNITGKCLRLKV